MTMTMASPTRVAEITSKVTLGEINTQAKNASWRSSGRAEMNYMDDFGAVKPQQSYRIRMGELDITVAYGLARFPCGGLADEFQVWTLEARDRAGSLFLDSYLDNRRGGVGKSVIKEIFENARNSPNRRD